MKKKKTWKARQAERAKARALPLGKKPEFASEAPVKLTEEAEAWLAAEAEEMMRQLGGKEEAMRKMKLLDQHTAEAAAEQRRWREEEGGTLLPSGILVWGPPKEKK